MATGSTGSLQRLCFFFVKQYLSMGEHTKPETKAALKIAFPSLTEPDSKKLLNGLNDVKIFLKKKWKNLKSGEKNRPHPVELDESFISTRRVG